MCSSQGYITLNLLAILYQRLAKMSIVSRGISASVYERIAGSWVQSLVLCLWFSLKHILLQIQKYKHVAVPGDEIAATTLARIFRTW